MKSVACAVVAIVLMLAMGASIARSLPEVRPPAREAQPVYIIENPGKDGVIWSVGIGKMSPAAFDRRVRVYDRAEAEKMVALLLETAPLRFRFAGHLVI